MIRIDAEFESGNVAEAAICAPDRVDLSIRRDAHSEHYQWFHFRIHGAKGQTIQFRILNAGGASYSDGWKVHQPVLSADQMQWERIEHTDYDGAVYSFTAKIESDPAYLAYFYPYTTSDLEQFLESTCDHPAARRRELTRSVQGRPVHWIEVAEPEAYEPVRHSVWIIGRQHPGEPQGTGCAAGLLAMLLGESPEAARLRRQCVFHVIPDINPDGVANGHHRTNAKGFNLNRAWKNPAPEDTPSIYAFQQIVKQWKQDRPIDLFIDLHSDEIERANVVYGISEEVTRADYQKRQAKLLGLLQEENSDFSAELSRYYSGLDTRLARQWMFVETGALSYTYEMTYHDAPYSRYDGNPMTPQRVFELGQALGRALTRYFNEGHE